MDASDARQAGAEACSKATGDRATLEDAACTLAGLIGDTKALLAAKRDWRERAHRIPSCRTGRQPDQRLGRLRQR